MNVIILEKVKSSNGRYKYLIKCLECGKKRWVKESIVKAGNGKFCSILCSQTYRKKHKEEYKKPRIKIDSSLRCEVCKILLTTDHHGFFGICYTLHREGSNLCYMCEIKKLKKEKRFKEADDLISEFGKKALKAFSDNQKLLIIKRLWH